MKKYNSITMAFALLAVAVSSALFVGCASPKSEDHAAHSQVYFCPMHHEVVMAGPGTCPKCGMKLVLKD